ncbi:hypothetical protein ACLOJK_027681 [Asimina triloba]
MDRTKNGVDFKKKGSATFTALARSHSIPSLALTVFVSHNGQFSSGAAYISPFLWILGCTCTVIIRAAVHHSTPATEHLLRTDGSKCCPQCCSKKTHAPADITATVSARHSYFNLDRPKSGSNVDDARMRSKQLHPRVNGQN